MIDRQQEQIYGVDKATTAIKVIDKSQNLDSNVFSIPKEKADFNSIWEIQKSNSFSGFKCVYNTSFRIKNLSSGLFLAVENDKLEL